MRADYRCDVDEVVERRREAAIAYLSAFGMCIGFWSVVFMVIA